ncbi:MAG: DMT family transporter [Bacteroidia bacterium]|nr:DMT family transporter [Bacteroidia bacterium]
MISKSNSPNFSAHAGLTIAAVIYGINYFTLKFSLNEGVHPWAILSLRSLTGLIAFSSLQIFFIREWVKVRKDLLRLMACAFFGVSFNQFFFLWGISKTTQINAGVLMIMAPAFVFLIAFLLRQEQFSWNKVGGLALAFVGAFLLIQDNAGANFSIGNQSLVGDLMIIANAASYGMYLVLVRPLVLKYNTFTIVFYLFLFGSFINIPLGASEVFSTDFQALTWQGWLGIFWILILTTLVVYFINAWAMKRVPSSSVGMYVFGQPVFVTLFSAIFISGSVSLVKVFFILMIIGGVFWVTRR